MKLFMVAKPTVVCPACQQPIAPTLELDVSAPELPAEAYNGVTPPTIHVNLGDVTIAGARIEHDCTNTKPVAR